MLNTPILILICLHFSLIIVGASDFEQDHCLISNELEERCGAVCYPTVKPLLRYVGSCHNKDKQLAKLKDRVRDQDVELIKWKSALDALNEFNQRSTAGKGSCGQNNTLRQAIEAVNQLKVELGYKMYKLHSIVGKISNIEK
ncbi:uncharacterized protein LOC111064720 [Drosophila obscura]|uniref:uncharacterized protein LOC111064720 n=1 Tax=Drosophila obscura TaxID=7282 RepID=UPI001BB0F814|nr:uncharacterized protein LOC111064720 [Drosophila obscura]